MRKIDASTVEFKPWFLRQSAKLAMAYLAEKKGIQPPRGFKIEMVKGASPERPFANPKTDLEKYANHLNPVLYKLCLEAFEHSYTPGGEAGQNPTLVANPKAEDGDFTEKLVGFFFGPSGFFATRVKSDMTKYRHNFISGYKTLLGVLVEGSVGLKANDFKHLSRLELTGLLGRPPTLDEETHYYNKSSINRYKREVWRMIFLHTLKAAFLVTEKHVDAYLTMRGIESGSDVPEQASFDLKDSNSEVSRRLKNAAYRKDILIELNGILEDLLPEYDVIGEQMISKLQVAMKNVRVPGRVVQKKGVPVTVRVDEKYRPAEEMDEKPAAPAAPVTPKDKHSAYVEKMSTAFQKKKK